MMVQSRPLSDSSFEFVEKTQQMVDATAFESLDCYVLPIQTENMLSYIKVTPPPPPPESAADVLLSEMLLVK